MDSETRMLRDMLPVFKFLQKHQLKAKKFLEGIEVDYMSFSQYLRLNSNLTEKKRLEIVKKCNEIEPISYEKLFPEYHDEIIKFKKQSSSQCILDNAELVNNYKVVNTNYIEERMYRQFVFDFIPILVEATFNYNQYDHCRRRQGKIFKLHFGIGYESALTFEQISNRFNISIGRARQLFEVSVRFFRRNTLVRKYFNDEEFTTAEIELISKIEKRFESNVYKANIKKRIENLKEAKQKLKDAQVLMDIDCTVTKEAVESVIKEIDKKCYLMLMNANSFRKSREVK